LGKEKLEGIMAAGRIQGGGTQGEKEWKKGLRRREGPITHERAVRKGKIQQGRTHLGDRGQRIDTRSPGEVVHCVA